MRVAVTGLDNSFVYNYLNMAERVGFGLCQALWNL